MSRTNTATVRALKSFAKENQAHSYAKGTGRLYVCDVDGAPWYTESHFAARIAARIGAGYDPCADLLGSYNLTPTPGAYEVNGTVTRVEMDPQTWPPSSARQSRPWAIWWCRRCLRAPVRCSCAAPTSS